MKSVSKSEITGGQLLGLGFVCIAGLVLILVGVSLGNLLGAVIGGRGILAIILSVGLILLGTVRALKSVKKLMRLLMPIRRMRLLLLGVRLLGKHVFVGL